MFTKAINKQWHQLILFLLNEGRWLNRLTLLWTKSFFFFFQAEPQFGRAKRVVPFLRRKIFKNFSICLVKKIFFFWSINDMNHGDKKRQSFSIYQHHINTSKLMHVRWIMSINIESTFFNGHTIHDLAGLFCILCWGFISKESWHKFFRLFVNANRKETAAL